MRSMLSTMLFANVFYASAVAEDVSSLLHRQKQEFSEAGQHGKGGLMASYLDDDIMAHVFIAIMMSSVCRDR